MKLQAVSVAQISHGPVTSSTVDLAFGKSDAGSATTVLSCVSHLVMADSCAHQTNDLIVSDVASDPVCGHDVYTSMNWREIWLLVSDYGNGATSRRIRMIAFCLDH